MSRLTNKVTAAGKQGGTGAYMAPEGFGVGPATRSGIMIDGAIYPLAGQPPAAQTHGWGNLSFLFWRRS